MSEREQRAAEELWDVMDGLPLALDQAGAYIEARQCSLSEYLELFRHHRKVLLQERGGPLTAHPDAVATTWSLSFQRVEQKNPGAAELLRLCAFLSAEAIPGELFARGATHFPAPLQALAASVLLLNDAISVLLAYSLVRRSPKQKTLSVHRLVQAVLQDALPEAEKRIWAERAMFAVNTAFPHVEHQTWPQCERLLPHALLAAQSIEQYHLTGEDAGRLLSKTAAYLQGRARYQEAEPLYQRALHLFEQHFGPEHPEVGTSLNGLAVLYWQREKYAEAELLYQQALHLLQQRLGPEHPEVVSPLNNLASLDWQQGQYAEVEPLYRRALCIWEQQLGLEHPLVATALNNLAEIYREQGRYAEAEPLFQRALQIWAQQLGPEHSQVASSLNNLAVLYREQGRYAEAERFFQHALRIQEQSVGSQHADTSETLYGLARLRETLGKREEAREWYTRALVVREQAIGVHHPRTTETRRDCRSGFTNCFLPNA